MITNKMMFFILIILTLIILIIFTYRKFNNTKQKSDSFSKDWKLTSIKIENDSKFNKKDNIPRDFKKSQYVKNLTGKNTWYIYYSGIQIGDLTNDFAQAILFKPKIEGIRSLQDKNYTKKSGPHYLNLEDELSIEFYVIWTYTEGNYPKISRVNIMVPHYNYYQERKLTMICQVKELSFNQNKGIISIELSLTAEIIPNTPDKVNQKILNIIVYSNGKCEIN